MADPPIGPPAGGTLVTVRGTGFLESVEGGVEVRFGDLLASEVTVVDDQTLTCLTPAGEPDAEVDVVITNSRGGASLAKGFTYLSAPRVSSDLNDDGYADIIVAAQLDGSNGEYSGAVFVFYGLPESEVMIDQSAGAAGVKLMGTESGDRFGSAVTSGDINGDGADDLVIGASHADDLMENEGCAYVFFGPLPESGVLYAQQADVVLTSIAADEDEFFGSSLSVGDVDGDFLGDLLVGAPGVQLEVDGTFLPGVGAAYAFLGTGLQTGGAVLADYAWSGLEADDAFGSSVLLADLNGDEISDVVIGARLSNPVVPPKKYNAGSVHVFLGGETLASGSASTAAVRYTGELPEDEFGTALTAGDMNGDGFTDLMVSAPGSHALGSETGRAYVFPGGSPLVGASATDAVGIYSGQQSNADFGRDITSSDLNGDGFADFCIGAPRNSFGANRNGRCYIFLGGEEIVDGLAHFADVIYTGEAVNGERFAFALEVIDIDGDALADVMSGAVGNDGGGASSGRVYVFQGAQALADVAADDDDLTLTGDGEESNFGSTISRGQ